MGTIHDLSEKLPHMTGEALCLHCKRKWQAVAPIGTVILDCPECGLGKGVFANIAFPDREHWQCHCGCGAFCVTQKGIHCLMCGVIQDFTF